MATSQGSVHHNAAIHPLTMAAGPSSPALCKTAPTSESDRVWYFISREVTSKRPKFSERKHISGVVVPASKRQSLPASYMYLHMCGMLPDHVVVQYTHKHIISATLLHVPLISLR